MEYPFTIKSFTRIWLISAYKRDLGFASKLKFNRQINSLFLKGSHIIVMNGGQSPKESKGEYGGVESGHFSIVL